jgi:hypothetical protein
MNTAKPDLDVTPAESSVEAPAVPVAIQIRRLEKLETTSPSSGASN